jgi:hypothetical protein
VRFIEAYSERHLREQNRKCKKCLSEKFGHAHVFENLPDNCNLLEDLDYISNMYEPDEIQNNVVLRTAIQITMFNYLSDYSENKDIVKMLKSVMFYYSI